MHTETSIHNISGVANPSPPAVVEKALASPPMSITQQFAANQHKQTQPAPVSFAVKDIEVGGAEKLVINLEKEMITSIISRSSEMSGNIKSPEGYRIDGSLEGNITSDTTVIVTEGARVLGQVRAARVIVLGTVEGSIDCSGQLIIAKSAVVSGEIIYKDIVTYQGATIEGTLRRIK